MSRWVMLYALLVYAIVVGAQCPSNKEDYAKVTLPWGTAQATDCNMVEHAPLYTFRNVRFGKSTNVTRFGASAYPDKVADNTTLLDQTSGPPCYQIGLADVPCPSGRSPYLGSPVLAPGADSDSMSEDCLFLDIYVPVSAVNTAEKLPVVVWFYGGAFLFGAKDNTNDLPFYQGFGAVEAARRMGKDVIFVAGNYRLGALGWLAGTTMQSSSVATPNAGLTDQRLVLQFIQDFISGFGGDPENVSAWGESAGGGSILHHLIAMDAGSGKPRDPLFKKALIQSAAFQWQWDNSPGGSLDKVFKDFTDQTTCADQSPAQMISCLQQIDTSDILAAMQKWWNNTRCRGIFSIGPAVDGKVITQLPAIAFESTPGGGFYPIDSIIASHVKDESGSFVPPYVTKNRGFAQLLATFLPGDSKAINDTKTCINNRYYSANDQITSAKNMIRDALFTCNTRFVYDGMTAASKPVWLMEYMLGGKWGAAVHASDLFPTYWWAGVDQGAVKTTIQNMCKRAHKTCPGIAILLGWIGSMRRQYQTYFVGHAISGDPNAAGASPTWQPPKLDGQGNQLSNVMGVYWQSPWKFFNNSYADTDNTKYACSFWTEIAKAVTTGQSPACPSAGGLWVQNDLSDEEREL